MFNTVNKRRRKLSYTRVFLTVVALLAVLVGTRIALAVRQVNQTFQVGHSASLSLETTSQLTILPVFEAWASSNEFQSEHGVSYLIQTDHATVLMDLGNNEGRVIPTPLQHNMQQLDLETNEIDSIVISHNHPDHVGGMTEWRKGSFPTVEGSEATVYTPVELVHSSHETVMVSKPLEIAPGVATLGRIPFLNPFPFLLWQPLEWEQSVVVNVEGKGLVVIMGCGHPSVERIVREAESQFGLPVVGVFGGLHYGKATEEELKPHIDFLAKRSLELVALSPHDSSGTVLQAFESAFPSAYRYITVGSPVHFPQGR